MGRGAMGKGGPEPPTEGTPLNAATESERRVDYRVVVFVAVVCVILMGAIMIVVMVNQEGCPQPDDMTAFNVTTWVGRLGNQIMQTTAALHQAAGVGVSTVCVPVGITGLGADSVR